MKIIYKNIIDEDTMKVGMLQDCNTVIDVVEDSHL